MPIAKSAHVHPTAIVDPEADLGEDVVVGPRVVIEGHVQVGPGCVLKNGAHLIGPLTMGGHNTVHSYAVLGDAPQHLKYNGDLTRLEIGEQNVFREHVTVHRAATPGGVTRLGNRNFLMANSHVGHDSIVGNNCILVNAALVGGHAVIQDNAMLSGGSAVHQFARVGRLALLGGLSGASMDLPPFMILQYINVIAGVNVIGMRRAGVSNGAIDAIRKAFHVIYRSDMLLKTSLAQVERDHGHVPEVAELLAFIRASKRGISLDCNRQAA
jgi:UDP-N-acetylglucosamine acyltransferase